MMNLTSSTISEQIERQAICRAYDTLESLDPCTEIGCTWRVRGGQMVRIEFYKRHRSNLVDLPELNDNMALAYLQRDHIGSDCDQANYYSSVKVLLCWLEYQFGSSQKLKMQALADAVTDTEFSGDYTLSHST